MFFLLFRGKKGETFVVKILARINNTGETTELVISTIQDTRLPHISDMPSDLLGVTNSHSASNFQSMRSNSETVDDILIERIFMEKFSVRPEALEPNKGKLTSLLWFRKNVKGELIRSAPYERNLQEAGSCGSIARFQRIYQCGYCPVRFERSEDLVRHRDLCHRITKYKCILCTRIWDMKEDFFMHFRNSHADKLHEYRVSFDFTQLRSPRDRFMCGQHPPNMSAQTLHSGRTNSTVDSQSRKKHSYSHWPSIRLKSDFSPAHVENNDIVTVSDMLSISLNSLQIDPLEKQPNTNYNTAATNANIAAMSGSDELSINFPSLHITAPVLPSHIPSSHTVNS